MDAYFHVIINLQSAFYRVLSLEEIIYSVGHIPIILCVIMKTCYDGRVSNYLTSFHQMMIHLLIQFFQLKYLKDRLNHAV